MKTNRLLAYAGVAVAWVVGLSVASLSGAQAQTVSNWPTKPVRVIVNYAPGGSTDNATRPFMDRLSQAMGQQFIIENGSYSDIC